MAEISELSGRIADDNAVTRYHLTQQLRSPLGVIPFVGAGMSVRFGFRGWGMVLREAAAVENPQVAATVDGLLKAGDYEQAAEVLRKLGEDNFQRRIEKEFGRSLELAQLRSGPLTLLPLLTSGPIITTNFDHALESTFRALGQPFSERILGPEPDRILKAIHRNARVLIKMHGDCEDRKARTFTKEEYEANYGAGRTGLSSLVWLMFTNRPLLFLGCSLTVDRTVQILERAHRELGGLTHYAVVEAPATSEEFQTRRKQLLDLGISPLWFHPRRFDEIETLLAELIDGMSVKDLVSSPSARSRPPPPAEVPPDFHQTMMSPVTGFPEELRPHLEQVWHRLREGRLMFFVGAGAHLGALDSGDDFYQRLALTFGCPSLGSDRSAIAEYIIDRHGRTELWSTMREQFVAPVKPSIVLQFLATIPAQLRGYGASARASQWFITTNQDCQLEQMLNAAGESFHLLYYQGYGEHEGCFIHITPEGRTTVIERPESVRRLSDASVVVKLNGGIIHGHGGSFPESAVVARRDFARLAARIPDALPHVLQTALRERSLLFLGHGLAELDVEELVRFSSGPAREVKSWAVQLKAQRVKYWAQCGLEVIEADLRTYIPGLYQKEANPFF